MLTFVESWEYWLYPDEKLYKVFNGDKLVGSLTIWSDNRAEFFNYKDNRDYLIDPDYNVFSLEFAEIEIVKILGL